jgi:hypothetical protein
LLFGPITPVQVKLEAAQLARLDWWIAELGDKVRPTRAEAIRRLIDLGLMRKETPTESPTNQAAE